MTDNKHDKAVEIIHMAREAAASVFDADEQHDLAKDIRAGRQDYISQVQSAVAALKHHHDEHGDIATIAYMMGAKDERARLAALNTRPDVEVRQPFQSRVQPWMLACFGAEIAADGMERNHRFLEEALELVQSTGCTASEAYQLVDYVFGRDVGEPAQEVGGVMVTLAALCLAHGLDMHANAETELARVWTKVEAIRAKQAAKPKHSPLPQHVPTSGEGGADHG